MDKLIMLGTGAAFAQKCYNSCFALQDGDEYLLVDGGGGNGILAQLAAAEIPVSRIHNIYLTHEDTDRLFGVMWVIRMIAAAIRREEYEGDLHIYCHSDLVGTIRTIAGLVLSKKSRWLFDHRILFIPVYDNDLRRIMDHSFTFFDLYSPYEKQYGFSVDLGDGSDLVFLGDEAMHEENIPYAQGARYLMHEAFCLYSQYELYRPYEKGHVTVREACLTAESLGVQNLILFNTEDENLRSRKALFAAEGRLYYHGNIIVPDDLDEIVLS